MADVEALCKRVIVIHHGRILFDGDLSALSRPLRRVQDDRRRRSRTGASTSPRYGEVLERDGDRVTLRVPKAETAGVDGRLLTRAAGVDLTIEDPPIEDVIELVFAQERPRSEPLPRRRAPAGGGPRPRRWSTST